ncbi:MAG: ABC transporter ATP-binding protein [Desulfotomaculaceae bacterium]|nr:ABC transporter ATP-binding protein [Desulfotomaculaceae bacterium]
MIEVKNLSVSIHKNKAVIPLLKDVSFSLGPGKTLGIIGESGSGKSLVTYALLGLLNRTADLAGNIAVCGCSNLLKAGRQEIRQLRRHKIGYVPQNPQGSLTPSRKIGAQLQEVIAVKTGLRANSVANYAAELLVKVGFSEPGQILRNFPHQLSGGMCQRVAVAMAIAGGPEIILADEPTSSLDLVSKNEIMTLLGKAQEECNFAMILVTHDLGLALQYCHTLAVFYSGRLVELGDTGEVCFHPRHPYTKNLFGCFFHEMKGREDTVFQVDPPVLYERLPGCRYFACCHESIPACELKEPAPTRLGSGQVACWLYDRGESQ